MRNTEQRYADKNEEDGTRAGPSVFANLASGTIKPFTVHRQIRLTWKGVTGENCP